MKSINFMTRFLLLVFLTSTHAPSLLAAHKKSSATVRTKAKHAKRAEKIRAKKHADAEILEQYWKAQPFEDLKACASRKISSQSPFVRLDRGLSPIRTGETIIDADQGIPGHEYRMISFARNANPMTDDLITLYRGIDPSAGKHKGRKLAEEALRFHEVRPYDVLASKTAYEHHRVENGNSSQYTSWTFSKMGAASFAIQKGGVLVQGNFRRDEIVPSPNIYAEKEVLVFGTVHNFKIFMLLEDMTSDHINHGTIPRMIELTPAHMHQVLNDLDTIHADPAAKFHQVADNLEATILGVYDEDTDDETVHFDF